jgi:hypothetical protein
MVHLELEQLIAKANHSLTRKGFDIILDNSKALTHNVNIDYPRYFCFAHSKEEAIGKMMLSSFEYKHNEIANIIEMKLF